MSYMLQHLHSGWQVDQAILTEEERLVCIRFGHDFDPECMKMDELLFKVAEDVQNFCVIYLVDTTEVPDFTAMYELYDPVTVMFFYRCVVPAVPNGSQQLECRQRSTVSSIEETCYLCQKERSRAMVQTPEARGANVTK